MPQSSSRTVSERPAGRWSVSATCPSCSSASTRVGICMASAGAPKPDCSGAARCRRLLVRRRAGRPLRATWNRDGGDTRRDVAHVLVNESPQIGPLPTLPALVGRFGLRGCGHRAGRSLSRAWRPGARRRDCVGHWASQMVPMLWSPWRVPQRRVFYGFNGLMKPPAHQLLETAVGTRPLVAAGLLSDVAVRPCSWRRAPLCSTERRLRGESTVACSSLNQIHRSHHLRWAGVGDGNFGLFTTIWGSAAGYRGGSRQALHVTTSGPPASGLPGRLPDQLADPFRAHRRPNPPPNGASGCRLAEPARSPACGDVRDLTKETLDESHSCLATPCPT